MGVPCPVTLPIRGEPPPPCKILEIEDVPMHFTLFSLVLILAVGAKIFVEVRRGLGLGFVRSAVSLATLLISALGAIGLSVWLSDTPAQMFAEILLVAIPSLETLGESFAHLQDILTALMDTLLTPILFVCIFPILRWILQGILSIFFRTCWKYSPDDPRYAGTKARPNALVMPNYEPADAPWHRRHDRLLGGIMGGISGFLAALLLLSPVLGTLSTTATLLDSLKSMNANMEKAGVSSEALDSVEVYVYDGAATVLSAAGGDLIFDAVSVSTLNGHTVSLRREVKSCMDIGNDFMDAIKAIRNPKGLTDEKKQSIRSLGDSLNESEITRLLAADFLNGAAAAWLENDRYLGIPRPEFGEVLDPVLDGALQVCLVSTPDCAGRDITTFLNIYLIAVESGLTNDPDKDQLLAALDEGGVLDLIYAELRKNPCMAHLSDELGNTALRIMASAIDWADFSTEIYDDLMGSLAESMNLVNGMGDVTFEQKVETLTQYTLHYAHEYGFELPEAMARMASTAMVEQLSNSGKLDGDEMDEFFNYYLNVH